MIRTMLTTAMVLLLGACAAVDPARRPVSMQVGVVEDAHSYANTAAFQTEHIALDLRVDFAQRTLAGAVELRFKRLDPEATTLILDTRDLDIRGVAAAVGDEAFVPTMFSVDKADPVLGSALRITMPAGADRVRVRYATSPKASGLQWLTPAQTSDRRHPFLFTQSQAIHARSWIPLQDSPQIRATYEARIHTPPALVAVMSAEFDLQAPRNGDYEFHMPQPIPSYLIALAVGDLRFKAMSERTGIFAEPSVVDRAAKEFEDTEQMIVRSEALYGPYRWGRYDLLILPPAFPYGGMENPRLTFATPTVIAGDKSLVSLVAHELAHSWSGNLVTNASWNDFWLNEGFTNHLTYRIMEEVYGADRGNQERALGANDLKDTLTRLERDDDKTLMPDLRGRDPDDGVSDVPYERGALFLAWLESKFGRERFDAFLRGWFSRHAFGSVTTPLFLAYLDKHMLQHFPDVVTQEEITAWMSSPQMPGNTPWPQSDAFAQVDAQRGAWLAGTIKAADLQTSGWSPHQWRYFLDNMPAQLSAAKMAELDRAFALSETTNAAVAARWFRLAAQQRYQPAYAAMRRHLLTIGRMLLITPAYRELVKHPEDRELAAQIFREAKPGYHPIAQDTVEQILRKGGTEG
ncbi:MAG: M1 family metallopeptidase [Pseudomonadota bacterium]|nr:M1 family metallopeptidase [Pseudomonadota bacterium]